jgi:hypothetical protein
LQKAVAGTSREALLEPFSEPIFQRKFVFGLIEAERAMRRQHRNERARHILKLIFLLAPFLSAYHGIGCADPHIPTKFTNSRNVISAYYATLANLEFACPCLKTYPIWESVCR